MKSYAVFCKTTGHIHQVITTNVDNVVENNLGENQDSIEVHNGVNARSHKICTSTYKVLPHTPEVEEVPVYANGMITKMTSLAEDLENIGLTVDTAEEWVHKNVPDFESFKELLVVILKRSLSK